MDLGRREADQGAAPEFVALDIRGDEESPGPGPDLVSLARIEFASLVYSLRSLRF